ncbi:hypothetical protein GF319_15905, partial [Candidatus Bathyarchaeota archaeon]|nr:hypothetical protein [Candidatus Bathyarchaeota archaeon]
MSTQRIWTGGTMNFRDPAISPDASMWWDCPLHEIMLDPELGVVWYEDFQSFASGYRGLTETVTNSGDVAAYASSHGGHVELQTSDASVADNDETYLGSTVALYTPGAGRKLWFECAAKFTEANTDDANIILGLSSTYAANTLVDDGAGPPADYTGLVFAKV